MAAETKEIQEFEYQAEMQQLLHLIVNSLYTHPEIFLRELISNASDALNKVRFRQLTDKDILNPDLALQIDIQLEAKENTLSIQDYGIGMTKDDLIDRVGTVASSGTLELVKQLQGEGKPIDANLIGQFGVGFYSVFMVADEVAIETRHADTDSQGYRWTSKGEGKFSIEEIDRPNRGTTVTLKLKESANEFSEVYKVKNVIEKYSNFVDFPINVGEERANTVSALWYKSKSDISDEELNEFYKFVSNDSREPLGHLQLSLEGVVNFKALLFIPESPPLGIIREEDLTTPHLYSNRISIQENCKDLLPEYLRFVPGVVDTEDLPLNVSREFTQDSPVMRKIRNILVKRLLSLLGEWAEKEEEKYEKFFKSFGPLFKTGVPSDHENRDALLDLLRFESNRTEPGKFTSLKQYVEGMKEEQTEIYYLAGEHREVLERSPNLEYFRKNEIEVLFMTDPADAFILPAIDKYDEKPLKTIEKADIDVQRDEEALKEALASEDAISVIDAMKEILGDRVEDVVESKRLVDSAATLVVGDKGFDTQTERMMRMMNQEFKSSKKILEINTSHPLIKNLARIQKAESDKELIETCTLQLFEGALLSYGELETPAELLHRMTDIMERATRS